MYRSIFVSMFVCLFASVFASHANAQGASIVTGKVTLKANGEPVHGRNMSTTLGHSRAAFSEPRLWWGDS